MHARVLGATSRGCRYRPWLAVGKHRRQRGAPAAHTAVRRPANQPITPRDPVDRSGHERCPGKPVQRASRRGMGVALKADDCCRGAAGCGPYCDVFRTTAMPRQEPTTSGVRAIDASHRSHSGRRTRLRLPATRSLATQGIRSLTHARQTPRRLAMKTIKFRTHTTIGCEIRFVS